MTYYKYRAEVLYTVREDDCLRAHITRDMHFARVAEYIDNVLLSGVHLPRNSKQYSTYIPSYRIYEIKMHKFEVSKDEYEGLLQA